MRPEFGSLHARLTALGPVPGEEWDRLEPLLCRTSVRAGEALVRAGHPTDTVAFVERGLLKSAYAGETKEFIRPLRERSLVLDDAETRYRRFRSGYPGLEDRLHQYDVASYLGITPVFLSRLRGHPERKST